MPSDFERFGYEGTIEYEPCKVTDFSKLKIGDGVIHYKIYQQDGAMVDMTVKDTYSNRLLVSWIQIHDRHTQGPEWRAMAKAK